MTPDSTLENTTDSLNWLIPKDAQRKLLSARKHKTVVYLYGAIGFGKTQTVLSAVEGLKYRRISCQRGPFSIDTDSYEDLDALIIDDLQRLENWEERRQILELLSKKTDLWVILISRAPIPGWLTNQLSLHPFTLIDETDLKVDLSQFYRLIRSRKSDFPEELVDLIREKSNGNLSVLLWALEWYDKGYTSTDSLESKIREQLVNRVEYQLFQEWPIDLIEFLASLSVCDFFTTELAEFVTGKAQAALQISRAKELGNFVMESDDGYFLRRPAKVAMEHYALKQLGPTLIKDAAYNAGLFYELKGDLSNAIHMYEKSGRKDRIIQLLIRNSSRHVSNGWFYPLRRYYLALSEEEAESSLELMTSLSVLYDLLMQPEQSEIWRQRVKDRTKSDNAVQRREALRMSLYLDICLIHNGSSSMLSLFSTAYKMMCTSGFSLPEFSVTSNLPSLMNGGKDFSHWSAHDKAIAFSCGKLVSRVLGAYGKGLVPLALAESQYEKGKDPIEVLRLLSRAEVEITSGGKFEMSFVAAALKARLYIAQNQIEDAITLLSKFRKSAAEKRQNEIIDNLDALLCHIALLRDDSKTISTWQNNLEDTGEEFYVLHRYQYLTLVLVWIRQHHYLQAVSLLDKLAYYAEYGGRTMYQIEIGLYRTILMKRMKHQWMEPFLESLHLASKLRFIPIIAHAGPEITNCLEEAAPHLQTDPEIDQKWLKQLLIQSRHFSSLYPHYLQDIVTPELSANGLQILILQARGLSAREISAQLSLKLDNVRYHIKENYRRLGVTSKAEAVLRARDLHLI